MHLLGIVRICKIEVLRIETEKEREHKSYTYIGKPLTNNTFILLNWMLERVQGYNYENLKITVASCITKSKYSKKARSTKIWDLFF